MHKLKLPCADGESGKIPLAILEKMMYNVLVDAGVMELVDVVDSKSTGTSPSAACGGYSEDEVGAAVDEGRRLLKAEDIRRAPQTLATFRCRKAATLFPVASGRERTKNTHLPV